MINKLQVDPNNAAFGQRIVKELNSFTDITSTFSAANTAKKLSHGLGKLPSHAYLRSSDKPASLYMTAADVAAWTTTTVTLRVDNSTVSAIVRVE